MQPRGSSIFDAVWKELEKWGILLELDSALPSVAGMVAGSGVRGSWWAHPRGRAIFRVTRQLADHPDVLVIKLISGKVTYVHRRLWPAFVAVATSHEAWQLEGLSSEARALFSQVTKEGPLRTDQTRRPGSRKVKSSATRELEERLLIHTEELHTESGAHAKHLESWEHWTKRVGFRGRKMKVDEAKEALADVVRRLKTAFGGKGQLPWARVSPS